MRLNMRLINEGEVVVTIDIDEVEHEGRGTTLSDALIDLAYEVGDDDPNLWRRRGRHMVARSTSGLGRKAKGAA